MSSILSTQNRHIFLRRKYCFLPAIALSPPVGRCEPLTGLPPLVSAMFALLDYPFVSSAATGSTVAAFSVAGAAGAGCAAGAAGAGCPAGAGAPGNPGAAACSPGAPGTPSGAAGAATCGAGL